MAEAREEITTDRRKEYIRTLIPVINLKDSRPIQMVTAMVPLLPAQLIHTKLSIEDTHLKGLAAPKDGLHIRRPTENRPKFSSFEHLGQ